MYSKLKTYYIIIIIAIIGVMVLRLNYQIDSLEERLDQVVGTTSFQMYESIEKWSDSFDIPKHIAYNVAYLETRYRGPFDTEYNHKKESSAGAVGPMQIITKWARPFTRKRITESRLKQDIDLNVMISMKMLRKWYSIHHDWTLACGAYNSGRPIRNEYAVYATSNKNYKNKWINYE